MSKNSNKIEALLSRAVIDVIAEYDDTPVRGNVMASGDDDFDRQCEDEVIDRLDRGDVWAWARVEVCATLDVGDMVTLTSSAYLGGCTFGDEEDFRSAVCFEDMKHEVLEGLRSQLEQLRAALSDEVVSQ